MSLLNSVNDFILNWNSKFLIDYWWRKRYNVSFGSEEHRKMNFIDMLIEYQETKIMNKKEVSGVDYGFDNLDADYDNLDLDQFDKKQ